MRDGGRPNRGGRASSVSRGSVERWIKLYVLLIAVVWTAVLGIFLLYDLRETRQDLHTLALSEARAAFNKDIVFRRWAAKHGGVYVPATADTPPNPYLKDVEERDITTPSGRHLTLMNPAYMTRQIHETDRSHFGIRGHITSLNPIRPQNAPDPWEQSALERLTPSNLEFTETTELEGNPYLRLMTALITEESCLKCHASQGYKEGDLRGGISVSIPFEPFLKMMREHTYSICTAYGTVWLLGLCGLGLGTNHLRRRMRERDEAVDALQISEQRWQFALEGAGDGVWDWDIESNRAFYSSQWKAILGYDDSDIGVGLEERNERIHPEDREAAAIPIAQLTTGESSVYQSEHRMRCKDGTYKWVLDRGKVVEWTDDGKPRRIIGTQADVMERKQSEERLCARLERARNQQEAAATLAVLPELITGDLPNFARRVTELGAKVMGVERCGLWLFEEHEEMLRCFDLYESSRDMHSSGALIPRHEYEHEFRILETAKYVDASDALTDPRTARYVEGYIKPCGITSMLDVIVRSVGKTLGTLCFEQVGRPHRWEVDEIAFGCLLGDQVAITLLNLERRRTEEALRESETHNKAMRQAMPDMVFLISRDHVYLDFHAPDMSLLIAPPDAFLGRNVEEVLPPEVSARFKGGLDSVFSTGLPTTIEYEVCIAEEPKSFECRMVLCGKESVLSVVRDITEQKRAEAEHLKLEAQLRQAQKMEAVGQLAGGVAHDFNNLLQGILGYTDLLRERIGNAEDQDSLTEIHKAASRAADLTRQLLAFSRRQIIKPVNVDLNRLVRGVLRMIQRVIGEHIELKFNPAEQLYTVRVDEGQLEQVIMNLCVNARDAMPKGGILSIETANVLIDEEFCRKHPGITTGRYVLLKVTDTGCGMDEATRLQIFEPFFTTKGVGEGTGLGLSTVYGIVKHHCGHVDVQSRPGDGATFSIYLPMVEYRREETRASNEPRVSGGTETILVAEDSEMVRSLAVRILTSAGYRVLAARNGEDAIRVFQEHAGEIDLALLDVMMPRMGGREVMERIQAQKPNVRFLFCSGYNDTAIHTDFVIEEGFSLVTKPYSTKDLLREIRTLLDAAPIRPGNPSDPKP